MRGYTTKSEIENYLLKNIDASFDDQIDNWIGAMESYVEKETGRVFIADESFSTKKYDGDNEDNLIIDDCIEIDSVTVEDKEVDYFSYPANSTPITKLILEDDYFDKGLQNVEVSAKWGYSEEVPDDIKFAVTVLVAGIVNDQSGEGVSSETIGPYSVTYKDKKELSDFENVKKILEKYKRYDVC